MVDVSFPSYRAPWKCEISKIHETSYKKPVAFELQAFINQVPPKNADDEALSETELQSDVEDKKKEKKTLSERKRKKRLDTDFADEFAH